MPEAMRRDITTIYSRLRWAWPLLLAVLAALYFLSGFYVIKPEEEGVVRRFGRVVSTAVSPGMHYRLPWPIDRLDKVRFSEVRRMSVGFKFIEREAGIAPSVWETQFLTGDTNIINIQMIVQYVIKDSANYLFNVEDVRWLIRKAAETALAEKVAGMNVDDVLTIGKLDIQSYVKGQLQALLDGYGSGLQILGATLQEVRPPDEVSSAFRDVASAREDKQRKVNEAEGYRNEVLPRAKGEREKIIAAAEADKEARIKRAKGDTERFLARLTEYKKSPAVTADRIYIESMEKLLSEVKKYIVGQGEDSSSPMSIKFLKKP